MDLRIDSTLTLNDGFQIPRFGLGVYQTPPGDITRAAVLTALEAGYRMIDSAAAYRNEVSVGEGLRESGLSRDAVFVTTKLWNSDHGYERAKDACRKSLERLGLEYVDLYLIHWPVEDLRADSWRAMEKLKDEGLCRSIGVSNYTIRHMEEILVSCRVVPCVNQVEFSPFLYQKDLQDRCAEAGVYLQAYSPLTKAKRLDDRTLTRVAESVGKTTAQVLIRWALQRDTIVIPKSQVAERIRENADVFDFDLTPEQMATLDGLDDSYRTSWDPTDQP